MSDLAKPVLPGTAGSDYERYLRTEELLALQKTADEWIHRDEQSCLYMQDTWLVTPDGGRPFSDVPIRIFRPGEDLGG